MSTPLEILKFNLQERSYPHFDDAELSLLLEKNNNSMGKASYEGCLMKAEAEDKMEVSGIKLNSNRDYWLTLANKFLADVNAEIEAAKPISSSGYITSRGRADGC